MPSGRLQEDILQAQPQNFAFLLVRIGAEKLCLLRVCIVIMKSLVHLILWRSPFKKRYPRGETALLPTALRITPCVLVGIRREDWRAVDRASVCLTRVGPVAIVIMDGGGKLVKNG